MGWQENLKSLGFVTELKGTLNGVGREEKSTGKNSTKRPAVEGKGNLTELENKGDL